MTVDEVIDLLEAMAEEHFIDYGDGDLGHAFMAVNEAVADALATLRPWRWRATDTGVRRIDDTGAPPP